MNLTPEQQAREKIDSELVRCGWIIQNKLTTNLAAGPGIVITEYWTDAGPADYMFFVNRKPVGVIEAKRAEEGVHLTIHEDQNPCSKQQALQR